MTALPPGPAPPGLASTPETYPWVNPRCLCTVGAQKPIPLQVDGAWICHGLEPQTEKSDPAGLVPALGWIWPLTGQGSRLWGLLAERPQGACAWPGEEGQTRETW